MDKELNLQKSFQARLLFVQILYKIRTSKTSNDFNILVHNLLELDEYNELKDFDEDLFTTLAQRQKDNILDCDNILEKYLNDNWKISRLSHVLLSIFSAAMIELKYSIEFTEKEIINDYVNICLSYGYDNDQTFFETVIKNICNKEKLR